MCWDSGANETLRSRILRALLPTYGTSGKIATLARGARSRCHARWMSLRVAPAGGGEATSDSDGKTAGIATPGSRSLAGLAMT